MPPFPPFGGQPVFSLACVTKTRSPQTAGVELPLSGSAAFQRTFSLGPHFTGRPFSPHGPWPPAPRQPGQSSALAADDRLQIATNAATALFIARPSRQNCNVKIPLNGPVFDPLPQGSPCCPREKLSIDSER